MSESRPELNRAAPFPPGWRSARLGEVCEKPQYGYTASAVSEDVGPKFLRITDIQNGMVDWDRLPHCRCGEEVATYSLKPGDILFARTGGTTGKSYLVQKVPSETVFASYLIRVRTENDLMPDYLYQFLQSASYWSQIGISKRGGAQPNVNATQLSSVALPLPPLPQQKRIAANVRDLMDQVERARTACETQLQAAQALPQAYLRQVFESDEANKWRPRTLGQVCDEARTHDPRLSPDAPFRYIDISSIDTVSKRITEARTITGKDAPSRARQLVKTNDVLLATTRPNLNAVAIVPADLDSEICSTAFCVLRPTGMVDPAFLYFFVQLGEFVRSLSGEVRGMLYPAVTNAQVRYMNIPLPPLPEQKRIGSELKEKTTQVGRLRATIEKQLASLGALPQAILEKAFQGDL